MLARRCARSTRDASAAPGDVWREVLTAFAHHLEPHFEIEERHLLPALEAIGEPQLAERIRADHAALRRLRKIRSPSPEELEEFGELLESHVRFEERRVFEATQHRLPEEALRAIAEACRRSRSPGRVDGGPGMLAGGGRDPSTP